MNTKNIITGIIIVAATFIFCVGLFIGYSAGGQNTELDELKKEKLELEIKKLKQELK